jgi:drug/metabolite transporter (DMT)-like permease
VTSAPPAVYALALLPAVLWGFGPVLDKLGMDVGGSSLQGSLTVVAVDSLVYWLALFGLSWPTPLAGVGPRAVGVFVAAGVFGTAVARLAVFAGVDRVGASINSAAISTRPLFATVLAVALLGEPVGPLTALGVVVVVVGLVALVLSKGGDLSGWRARDLLFPVSAAAVFAVGNVLRRFGFTSTAATPLQAVAINELAALVVLGAYGVAANRDDVLAAPRASYAYFTGSGLLTAGALLSLYAAFAMDAGRVAIVDSLAATAPLFTTLFSALLLGEVERVTRGVVAGAALVVAGVVLITL